MEITTPEELFNAIMGDLFDVSFDVAEKTNRIIQNHVAAEVYDANSPSEYERLEYNGGFIGSWETIVDADQIENGIITTENYSNGDSMTYDGNKYQHGNKTQDRRQFIDAAIAEGIAYDIQNENPEDEPKYWMLPRDYMTPAKEEVSENLDVMFINSAKENGIKVIKIF